jgi:carboxylesterase family protein
MKAVVVTFIVFIGMTASGVDSDPTVTVTGGRVRGVILDNGGAVFKGIPYAQPPIGDLRWREPMLVKPWTIVRDATAFGAICAQDPGSTPNAGEISQEDCLFLNVWTPEWPSRSRKPVMVWLPGGGNFSGGSTDSAFDGERLADASWYWPSRSRYRRRSNGVRCSRHVGRFLPTHPYTICARFRGGYFEGGAELLRRGQRGAVFGRVD